MSDWGPPPAARGIPPTRPHAAALAQSVNDNSWFDLLNITGKGFLSVIWVLGVIGSGTSENVDVRLTVDGSSSSLFDVSAFSLATEIVSWPTRSFTKLRREIPLLCRFEKSLRIELRRGNSQQTIVRGVAVYSLDL